VDAALRHLMLPGRPEEEKGREDLARIHAEAVARMLELVPKRTLAPVEPSAAANADGVEMPHHGAENVVPTPADPESAADVRAEPQVPEVPEPPPAPKVDLSRVLECQSVSESALVDATDATDAVDVVLAEGGFLPAAGEA